MRSNNTLTDIWIGKRCICCLHVFVGPNLTSWMGTHCPFGTHPDSSYLPFEAKRMVEMYRIHKSNKATHFHQGNSLGIYERKCHTTFLFCLLYKIVCRVAHPFLFAEDFGSWKTFNWISFWRSTYLPKILSRPIFSPRVDKLWRDTCSFVCLHIWLN